MGRKSKPFKQGERFGRLTIIAPAPLDFRSLRSGTWLVKCDCGNEFTVQGVNLQNGGTTSCGCYRREKAQERGRKKSALSPEAEVMLGLVPDTHIAKMCSVSRERVRVWRNTRNIPPHQKKKEGV